MYSSPRYMLLGDQALIVEFGSVINPEVNHRVHTLHEAVSKAKLSGVIECVPTYRSLLVVYDPAEADYDRLAAALKELERRLDKNVLKAGRKVTVPVVYGGDFGPDLAQVAAYHELTEADVIRIHSEHEYTVYMIGFIAGFPYMGELAQEIATPRLETPRLRVPEGSVGIAERQTGIYPREAPGGWQIIGKTPIRLFDSSWSPPAVLQPSDRIRFRPILAEEFERVHSQVVGGQYNLFSEDI